MSSKWNQMDQIDNDYTKSDNGADNDDNDKDNKLCCCRYQVIMTMIPVVDGGDVDGGGDSGSDEFSNDE